MSAGTWIKLQTDTACDGCEADCHYLYEIGRSGSVRSWSTSPKAGVQLCEDCLAQLLEGLTAFGWVKQLNQWRDFAARTRRVARVENRKDR